MIQEVEPKRAGKVVAETSSRSRADVVRRPEATVDGLVLAGTHSWGDDILERAAPRPLWPVALSPLIAHGIQWLRGGGVSSACVCANSETSVLKARFGTGESLGVSVTYYEDRMPRGPAGCARDASLATQGDTIIIVEGSIMPCVDFDALIEAHLRSQAALTVAVREAGGRPTAHGREGDQASWDQSFESRLEPIGIYACSRAALGEIPASGYQDIKEGWIPRLYAAGLPVVTHRVSTESAPRVTGSASYLEANLRALSRLDQGGQADRLNQRGFRRRQRAWVHESAMIAPTASLKGPVLIGPKCHVHDGVMMIGPVVLGRRSVVERNAVVIRSVIWDQCTIRTGAMIDHSILAHLTSIDAGVVTRKTVVVATGGRPSHVARSSQ